MTTYLGFLMLSAAGLFGWWYYQNFFASTARNRALAAQDQRRLAASENSIVNVGPGGVIGFQQVGPEFEDFDIRVTAKHLHKQGTYRWQEVEGESARGPLSVVLGNQSGGGMFVTLKRVTLKDLGVSLTDLAKIGDEQQGSITFEGQVFEFFQSGSALLCPNGDELVPQHYDFIVFRRDEDRESIDITRDDSGAVQIYYRVAVATSQVTVFSIS